MKLMTLEQIVSQCPTLKRNIERANLVQYWGEYLSSYDPDNSDLLQAALEYAAHGWHVFPCSPTDKTPLTRHGFKDATRDPEAIKKFWREHPNAMIGVAAGEKSGAWCLDVDVPTERNPIDGRESWKALQAEHGAAPTTHTHRTPRGGMHLIFQCRADRAPITNRVGALKGRHIDMRGEGGYFIAAGSVNSSGIAYTMADEADYFRISPAPDWLHDLIEGKAETDQPELMDEAKASPDPVQAFVGPQGRTDQRTISQRVLDDMASGTYQHSNLNGTGTAYAKAALNRECAELAMTSANRNDRLNIAAISLGRFVKSRELTEAEVTDALLAACETNGLNKDDGRKATKATIRSGMGAATARIIPAAVVPARQKSTPTGQVINLKEAKAKADAVKAADKVAKAEEKAAKAKAMAEAGVRAGADRETKLAQLNEKYQVVNDAGRVRVMSFDAFVQTVGGASFTRYVPSFLSFYDFANLLQNQTIIQADGKDAELGSWWLHHERRLTFGGLIFRPNAAKVIDGKLNLWRGWGVVPKAGDWGLMREHIRLVMCSGKPEMYDYVIKWLAWAVQNPDQQAEVALVFRGGKGTGKGTLGSVMCQMFGGHAIHISNAKHLTGFNSHMRDACFMFADEAYWPGDKKAEGDLKRLVTESTLFIEGKGRDAITAKNMLHVLMASNEDWIVPATERERRWVVNEVSDCHQQDASWFEPIYKQMAEGGTAAMLHYLLAYDLEDFHPRKIPANCGLLDQQMRSLSPLDMWWLELLEIGSLAGCDPRNPSQARSGDYEETIKTPGSDFDRVVKRLGLYSQARQIEPRLRNHTSDHAFGKYLAKAGCNNEKRVCRKTGWAFPPLKECREKWAERFPGTVWRNPSIETWQPEDFADNLSAESKLRAAWEAHRLAEERVAEAELEVEALKPAEPY